MYTHTQTAITISNTGFMAAVHQKTDNYTPIQSVMCVRMCLGAHLHTFFYLVSPPRSLNGTVAASSKGDFQHLVGHRRPLNLPVAHPSHSQSTHVG